MVKIILMRRPLPIALVVYSIAIFCDFLQIGEGVLVEDYYKETCPGVEHIVRHHVKVALWRDPTMAASLLRLHFHDCFVMGCDGSVLLDSGGGVPVSEKEAVPNKRSVRGFAVIDRIKFTLEEACPHTVSCADILTLAARDAVYLRGGPDWSVELGRRDSFTASFSEANRFIPAPNLTLDGLITNFRDHGLTKQDLVSLSGGHTIGRSRCVSFRQRIYQHGRSADDYPRYAEDDREFHNILRSLCPESGGDDIRTALDFSTSVYFDNRYYLNLIGGKGLLTSDRELVSQAADDEMAYWVWAYATDQQLFFRHFVESMVKMGRINPLTGADGEIREHCRYTNAFYGQNEDLRRAFKAQREQADDA